MLSNNNVKLKELPIIILLLIFQFFSIYIKSFLTVLKTIKLISTPQIY